MILGNRPTVGQAQGLNASNVAKRAKATIPGLTTNQWVSGHNVPQGMTLNTPMVYRDGVRGQYYNPQYATQTPAPQVAGTKPGFGGTAGQYRGANGELVMPQNYKPGAGPGGTYGTAPQGRMGGYAPFGGMLGSIQTSVQPQAIYEPWMTQNAVNQAVANADQRGNLQTLMGGFDTPGVSRSSRHAALAAPQAAQAQLTAADAKARIPFDDMMANQRNLFLGQVAREQEALGLGNLQARMYEAQNQDALSRLNQGLSYLQTLIG